jgi:hypothetical protein
MIIVNEIVQARSWASRDRVQHDRARSLRARSQAKRHGHGQQHRRAITNTTKQDRLRVRSGAPGTRACARSATDEASLLAVCLAQRVQDVSEVASGSQGVVVALAQHSAAPGQSVLRQLPSRLILTHLAK